MTAEKRVLDSPWMTVPEVVAYTRTGRTEVMTALNDQSLRGYQNKAGGRWRVHREDADAWVRGEPATRTAPPIIGRRSA